ncbi:MAG: hypothetical protein QW035_01090 [Candidatus Anstonellales archaeon]
MLTSAIRRAYYSFVNRPIEPLKAILYYTAFSAFALLSPIGATVLITYLISMAGIDISSAIYLIYVIAAIMLFAGVLLLSGFKGAFVHSLYTGDIVKAKEYIRYSLVHLQDFLTISIIKSLLHSVVLAPTLALYYFVLPDYLNILFLIINVPIIVLIELFFAFSYISVAQGQKPIKAITDSMNVVRLKAPDAVPAFIIYAGIYLTRAIPLFNIFSHFILYPIGYKLLIEIYKG